MKPILTLLVILGFQLAYSQNTIDLYTKNIEVSQELYQKGIINQLINLPHLNEKQKQALALAEYYKFSVQDIEIPEMKQVLSLYYNLDYSKTPDEQVETEFAKLIKYYDDQFNKTDFSLKAIPFL
jgi:hypothetical protein